MEKEKTVLPLGNKLRCAVCDDPSQTDLLIRLRVEGRVVQDVQVTHKGKCDHSSVDWEALDVDGGARGIANAWETLASAFARWKWPAPMRRKLFAYLRDASRLKPRPETYV